MSVESISYLQLGLATLFIVMAGVSSVWLKLGLGKDLIIGTIRTFAQLFLMGYVLRWVFDNAIPWVTLVVFSIMVVFAARIVHDRVRRWKVPVFAPILISMFITYGLASVFVVAALVGAEPWWHPRYFLTLGGMVLGNAMNAMALSLDRYFAEFATRRLEIETMLSLGADPEEATRPMMRQVVRAGMLPSINSLAAVGVVMIPGMMSGQILAGLDPVEAIKYQIIVMLMLTGAACMGSLLSVRIARRKLFNKREQPVALDDNPA